MPTRKKPTALKKSATKTSRAKRGATSAATKTGTRGATGNSPRQTRPRKGGLLATYHAKRDFSRTAEPAGEEHRSSERRSLRFVIQKHAASHLHFDLRLELDGVMKSWAVPKGPHYDPTVRRLAMEVEDHPIEYNSFEGTIPQGEYGGGTVMIWDRGVYGPERGGGEGAIRDGYERGDLKFAMEGSRMLGAWVLVRTRRDDRGRAQWLLIKHRDEYAQSGFDVVAQANTSIVTGRTMDEIARGAPSRKRGTRQPAASKRARSATKRRHG